MSVQPFAVDDYIPEKTEGSVKQLSPNRSGGPYGMWVEHLKRCLAEARKADTDPNMETPDASNWRKVEEIVQMVLQDRQLSEKAT